MPKPGYTGVKRIVKAAGYSLLGIRAAWAHESAFRQECVLVAVLLPLAFWLGRDAVEVSILIGATLQVLIVELLNSGIEAVVDRIGPEHHELAGQAKDMASAAVAFSLVLLALVWGMFVWERFA